MVVKGGATKAAKGGKDAKEPKKRAHGDHPGTPVGPPQPALVITSEQLIHKNWWPVIGLVVENSPVESLLVDLMVDCVEGNSVITVKKDDILQEAQNLLKLHAKPFSPDEALSRRELEKRVKKQAEAEQRERERMEKERLEGLLAEGGGETEQKSSNKMSKAQAAAAPKNKTEASQGKGLVSKEFFAIPYFSGFLTAKSVN